MQSLTRVPFLIHGNMAETTLAQYLGCSTDNCSVFNGESLSIDQVKLVTSKINKIRDDKETQVVIITNAEKLNHSCANALLKVLEEHPRGYRFVLTTDFPQAVLQTVRSRCMQKKYPSARTISSGTTELARSIWADLSDRRVSLAATLERVHRYCNHAELMLAISLQIVRELESSLKKQTRFHHDGLISVYSLIAAICPRLHALNLSAANVCTLVIAKLKLAWKDN